MFILQILQSSTQNTTQKEQFSLHQVYMSISDE